MHKILFTITDSMLNFHQKPFLFHLVKLLLRIILALLLMLSLNKTYYEFFRIISYAIKEQGPSPSRIWIWKNNFPTVFFGFDMKKDIFEGFKTALEKKEVEKALKARLGR